MTKAARLIVWLNKQVKKKYRMGATIQLTKAQFDNLSAFQSQQEWDCSELGKGGVWAVGCATINGIPTKDFDPARRQWEVCKHISREAAISTPGAFLFSQNNASRPHKIGHVAISLGNGYCIEARGVAYGVCISKVGSRFSLGGKVPELYEVVG